MEPKDERLGQILTSADNEVKDWPAWKQSADVRAHLESLATPPNETKATSDDKAKE
jgi:hypothetical protein